MIKLRHSSILLAGIATNITDEEYLDHVDQLMSKLNVFASCGSGWVIESLQSVEVKTATCQTINGSSYIETPNILKDLSKSLLNVKNKNNFCFLYCVAAALFAFTGRAFSPKSHKENVKQLKFNSSRMPMPLSSIQPFEKSNNISINVYQLENGKLVAVLQQEQKLKASCQFTSPGQWFQNALLSHRKLLEFASEAESIREDGKK